MCIRDSLYTGYKLCANVLKGEEGASWGFFIAGAAFLIIGAGMLFVAAKTAKQRSDAKKAAAAEEEKEHPVEPVQEPKRMTIAAVSYTHLCFLLRVYRR